MILYVFLFSFFLVVLGDVMRKSLSSQMKTNITDISVISFFDIVGCSL